MSFARFFVKIVCFTNLLVYICSTKIIKTHLITL